MNYFLSKYYPITNETLPEVINPQTIESLMQQDIPAIFSATKLPHITLTDAQTQAIKNFRNVLAQNYNYRREWLVEWEQNFNRQYGALENLLGGRAWVALMPTGVYVVTRDELVVWRIRANEPPICFENHDAVEPTQTGDVWLITWDKEIAKPTTQTAATMALDYAQKLLDGKTSKKRFDILIIENQVDISRSNQNAALKRRVLAIQKRLEKAVVKNKVVQSAAVEPPKKEIPMESVKEMESPATTPFIDLVATYFIKEKKVDNQNLICIDFVFHKTTIYKFKIENQQFIYQSEWQFETPESTRQLILSVEKEQIEAALKEIQEALADADFEYLLDERAEYVRLIFGDIKKGIDDWVEKCVESIHNHQIEHCVLLTDEWFTPVLSQAFQKQYPRFTGETHRKSSVSEAGAKLYDEAIYPDLPENITFQLYNDRNHILPFLLLEAGVPYQTFRKPHYLPFRSWILIDKPVVPMILIGDRVLTTTGISLDDFGNLPIKKFGEHSFSNFNFGLSVNGHFEVILHLKNNFKIINFNIGKL